MRLLRCGAILCLAGAGMMVSGFVPAEAHSALSSQWQRLGSGMVHADGPSPLPVAYDIEAVNYYCAGGGSLCIDGVLGHDVEAGTGTCFDYTMNTSVACAGLNAGYVTAIGPLTGATSGTPSVLEIYCAHYTSSGEDIADALAYSSAYVAATGYGAVDEGAITGKGTLLDWYQQNPNYPADKGEGNAAQVSSLMASLYRPATQGNPAVSGSVTGIQNTNNTTDPDSLNSGGFRGTINGPIKHYDLSGAYLGTTNGTISCMVGGPHAYDVSNAFPTVGNYPYFEGELEPLSD